MEEQPQTGEVGRSAAAKGGSGHGSHVSHQPQTTCQGSCCSEGHPRNPTALFVLYEEYEPCLGQ